MTYCPVSKRHEENCPHTQEQKNSAWEKDKLRKRASRSRIKEPKMLNKIEERREQVTEQRLAELQLPSLPYQNPNAVSFINVSRGLLEKILAKNKK